MNKLLIVLGLLMATLNNYAQIKLLSVTKNSDTVKSLQDTSAILRDQDTTASSFIFASSIGNTLFGNRNGAVKSKTFVNSTIVYSPSISYINKSGLSLGIQAYYLNDGISGFGISQYSITPGFELQGNKEVEFSVAFAHYIVNDVYSVYASPIQNDFYSSVMYKKAWLMPGIAIDYSTGTFKEVKRVRNLYDSTTNKIKSFSIITSVSHEFNLGKLLGVSDDFLFTPSLLLNTGNSKTAINHNTNTVNGASVFSRKRGKLAKYENSSFKPESIGLSIDLSYTLGKFNFAPQVYFDYTIPKIDTKQLETIINFTVNYTL